MLALVEDPKTKMPPTTTPDLSMPTGSLKHSRDVEVDLEALEIEYSRLAAEDGKLPRIVYILLTKSIFYFY